MAQLGLAVSMAAGVFAWVQAADARAERRAAEALRDDLMVVAEQVTKMTFVVADGSSRIGGFSKAHLEQIQRYKDVMRSYLSPGLDAEIENTIRDLNDQIRRQNGQR